MIRSTLLLVALSVPSVAAVSTVRAAGCLDVCHSFQLACNRAVALKRPSCHVCTGQSCQGKCSLTDDTQACADDRSACRQSCEPAPPRGCTNKCADKSHKCLKKAASKSRVCRKACQGGLGSDKAACRADCVGGLANRVHHCLRAAPRCVHDASQKRAECEVGCATQPSSQQHACRNACLAAFRLENGTCLDQPQQGFVACLATCPH